jgi:hypothetical protein
LADDFEVWQVWQLFLNFFHAAELKIQNKTRYAPIRLFCTPYGVQKHLFRVLAGFFKKKRGGLYEIVSF